MGYALEAELGYGDPVSNCAFVGRVGRPSDRADLYEGLWINLLVNLM